MLDHELMKRTFCIQHNPNCPSPWLIRLPGGAAFIDMKPYSQTVDILSFGKTFEEAADGAIKQDDDRKRNFMTR
jgi:hypothetical protein